MANKTAILAVKILGDAASAQKAAREAEKAVDGIEDHVKAAKEGLSVAGAAAGTALVAGVVGAVSNAQVANKLAGQLALTPEESTRLGKINGDLFADAYGDSLEQVAEASRQVIGNIEGMRSANEDTMRDITAKTLDVANTFDQDLGGITTAVGQMIRTGLAPDAATALDIITSGLQGNARAGEDLLDTLTEYDVKFQQLGLTGQVATGLIDQGLAAGARNTDLVADALKEFQIRATDGSTTSAAGFEALGLNAQQATAQIAAGGDSASAGLQDVLDRLRGMSDPVQRNAAAVALFGTQAEDLGDALFALDPSSAVQALGDVTGAAQRLDETVSKDQGFEQLRRQVVTTFTDIGAAALPVLEPVLTVLQQWAPVLGPLALVIAGVAGAVTIFSGAMKVFAAVQAIQTAAQWASNAAWLASPVTWIVLAIIVAIGLVVAAIVLVVKHWDTFRQAGEVALLVVRQEVDGFVNGVKTAWNWVKTLASALHDIGSFNFGSGFDKLSGLFGGGGKSSRTVQQASAQTQSVMRVASFARVAATAASTPSVSSSWTPIGGQAGRSGANGGGTTNTYNITMNGVIDRSGAAREIRQVLRDESRATGRSTVAGGVAW